MAGILILALAARLTALTYSPWSDEWASLFFAERPLHELWSEWMVLETNPPLYYTLLKGWIALFGDATATVRGLSVVAGMLSIALTAACARRLGGWQAALIAALLCALSARHVYFSTYMRGYGLALLGANLSLYGCLLLLGPGAPRRQLRTGALLHAAGASLAIYAHTTMLLWPAVAGLVAVIFALRRAELRAALGWGLAASLAIGLVSAWWLWITLLQLRGGAPTIAWLQPVSLPAYVSLLRQSALLVFGNAGAAKALSYLLLLLAAAAPVLRRTREVRLVAALLAVAILAFWAANQVQPIINGQTVYWMSGLAVLLVATSLAAIRPAGLRLAALCLVAGLLALDLVRAGPQFPREDWTALFADAPAGAGLAVVAPSTSAAFIADYACRHERGSPCPIRFVAVDHSERAGVFGQSWHGPTVRARRGEPAPLTGPFYVLDAAFGGIDGYVTLPPATARHGYALITLYGPVAPGGLIVAR